MYSGHKELMTPPRVLNTGISCNMRFVATEAPCLPNFQQPKRHPRTSSPSRFGSDNIALSFIKADAMSPPFHRVSDFGSLIAPSKPLDELSCTSDHNDRGESLDGE